MKGTKVVLANGRSLFIPEPHMRDAGRKAKRREEAREALRLAEERKAIRVRILGDTPEALGDATIAEGLSALGTIVARSLEAMGRRPARRPIRPTIDLEEEARKAEPRGLFDVEAILSMESLARKATRPGTAGFVAFMRRDTIADGKAWHARKASPSLFRSPVDGATMSPEPATCIGLRMSLFARREEEARLARNIRDARREGTIE